MTEPFDLDYILELVDKYPELAPIGVSQRALIELIGEYALLNVIKRSCDGVTVLSTFLFPVNSIKMYESMARAYTEQLKGSQSAYRDIDTPDHAAWTAVFGVLERYKKTTAEFELE